MSADSTTSDARRRKREFICGTPVQVFVPGSFPDVIYTTPSAPGVVDRRVTVVCGMCESRLPREPVTNLPDSENVPRIRRIFLEFSSKLGHMGIDSPAHDECAIAPHFAQQLTSTCNGTVAP